LGFKIETMLYR